MPSRQYSEKLALETLQTAFSGELFGRQTFGPERRKRCFRKPPEGTVEGRWHIYSSGYLTRLVEALENDYSALARVVGPGPFGSLIQRYVAAHPPRSFDLRYAGDRLATFLEQDPLTGDLPFLPDLARLEWLLAEAFVAKDPEPLQWGDLQAMDPETVSELPLVLNPGTVVIRSRWPLVDIWRLKDKDNKEISLDVEGHPSTVLVFRNKLQTRCRKLDETEARFLEAAARGASLAEIQAAWTDGDDPDVVRQLLEGFRRLVDEGLFLNAGRPQGVATRLDMEDSK